MKKSIEKYLNFYVVIGFIGFFSILYLFSFTFVLSDVSSGSSREMKKVYCEENPKECNLTIIKSTP
jgi:hypothetical protein